LDSKCVQLILLVFIFDFLKKWFKKIINYIFSIIKMLT
jgi:hypothetical protein